MDVKEGIKEEPVWFEGSATASFENLELESGMIPLKQETKSELTEARPTQENTYEPSAAVKEEVLTEEHIVDQLDVIIKEENTRTLNQVI
ncbi:uncharacterized protein [Anabrus simplex]|uniref:uncharacterized protein isoform X3 n=1 Tax=Anabrus simplex TaxID=316456 RepID=UPI0035A3C653